MQWILSSTHVQILEHSPWVQARTLFLLAVQQGDAGTPLTYTLRTRVHRKGAEDELSKVGPVDHSQALCSQRKGKVLTLLEYSALSHLSRTR